MNNHQDKQLLFLGRLDCFIAVCGGLLPVGIVMGNAGFEGVICLAGLAWLLRSSLAGYWGKGTDSRVYLGLSRHQVIRPWLLWYAAILLSIASFDPLSIKWGFHIAFIRHILFFAAMLDVGRRLPIGVYLLHGLAAGLLLAVVNTAMAHIVGFDLIGRPLARYTGQLKEGSRIAHLAAFAAPFYLGWALFSQGLTGRQKQRLLALAAVAISLVFITRIRTTILAMAAGLVLPFFMRRRWSKVLLLICGIIGILALVLVLTDPHMRDFASMQHRFYIWKISWLMWLDYPVFGTSISAYPAVFSNYASPELVTAFHLDDPGDPYWYTASHAHNLLLMVLAVNGGVGFILFCWFMVSALRQGFRDPVEWRAGLISWPIVFLAIGAIGTNIFDGMTMAIFCFFLVLACTDLAGGPASQ